MSADQLSGIDMMSTMCHPDNQDCMTKMQSLIDRMDAACCPSDCDAPPTECPHDCAVVAVPFLDRCGDTFEGLIRQSPDADAAETADQFGHFGDICNAALHGGH